MEIRKFKPGDRVVRKSDQLMMEVIKYPIEHHILVGDQWSEHDVECVWYDEQKERHKGIFDQRTLIKVEDMHGLFTI
jgi:hypothetical protein